MWNLYNVIWDYCYTLYVLQSFVFIPYKKNYILIIQVTLRAFFGQPGEWFEQNDLDGDKNSIFHDVDGSISNYRDTYVGRADNFLIRHPQCVDVPRWNGVVCSGKYSQVKTWVSYYACVSP